MQQTRVELPPQRQQQKRRRPPNQRKGCLGCFGFLSRQVISLFLAIIMVILTSINLYAGGQLLADDTCEAVHSGLFTINIGMVVEDPDFSPVPIYVDADYWETSLTAGSIDELTPEDLAFIDTFNPQPLRNGCIETYGFVNADTNEYELKPAGYTEYMSWFLDEDSLYAPGPGQTYSPFASIDLSPEGRFWLYFLLPAYLILLPIITIGVSRRNWGLWWYVMVTLVAFLALTSALLYVNFGEITGIQTLTDYGTGVFGGVVTGTALAFMSHLIEVFGDED